MSNSTTSGSQRSHGELITGCSIAACAIVVIAMISHHPVVSSHDAGGLAASLARSAVADRWVHGIIAATLTILTTGMLAFAGRLGFKKPHVALGSVASMLSLMFICLAVMLDGFVAPALAERCGIPSATCGLPLVSLLQFGAAQIEFLTRFGLFSFATAAACFAVDLLVRQGGSRVVGSVGVLVALIQFALLFGSDARLTPHSLGIMVVLQAGWYLSVASLMVLRRGPYAGPAALVAASHP